jgi:hypothetical protein
MGFDLIGFRPDPDFPDRYFEIALRVESALTEQCNIVIERPGQEKAFLSTGGWQAGYARIEVQTRQGGGGLNALRLPKSLIDFLEVGYNYKIGILDGKGEDLGFFVTSWNPDAALMKRPPASAPVAKLAEPAPEEPELPQELPVRRTGLEDVPPRKAETARAVIRCDNCNGEIFSTFAICPYCGVPVVQ